MIDYCERGVLKKFVNKKITLIGTYKASIYSLTHQTKKEIKRYLFKDVIIKGTKYTLDHLWIPESGLIHNVEIDNNLIKQNTYEIKGYVQTYFKQKRVEGLDFKIGELSYKIENVYDFKLITI